VKTQKAPRGFLIVTQIHSSAHIEPKGVRVAKERNIRVYGAQCEDIDIDLMTQIVMQMGRRLAQETMTDEVAPVERDDSKSEPAPPWWVKLVTVGAKRADSP
jgi:hypothetical protein